MKKILCLLLCLLMVLPMLASCANNSSIDDINKEASRFTTTLNMWLVTESELVADASALIVSGITPKKAANNQLSEAQKATVAAMSEEQTAAWNQVFAVSEAINKLTKAKYKIQLNLKYYLEGDYYAAVEAAFAEHKKNIDAGNIALENKTEETVYNEYGIPELKYPIVPDYEVDILFLGDYSKYFTYANNGWLVDMTPHLTESAIKLNSYVDSSYLQAAVVNNMLYALPNNHVVGEYVYLLADKALLKKYTNSVDNATIYDTEFKSYLDYIHSTYNGEAGAEKIYPIYSATGKVDLDFAHYWSYDMDATKGFATEKNNEFSIFGDSSATDAFLENNNLLADADYMKALANKTHYEKTAGYLTTSANDRAAVRIVKGGWELKSQYEAAGYEVLVMQYPELTNEEIYSSMYAIGKYSINDDRSAEIITFLNTNAEVRNILQYGVEGENYTLETEVEGEQSYTYAVPTAENLYVMDLNKTGNTFIAYANSKEGAMRLAWEKKQNLEMVKYPTLGLTFDTAYKLDENNIRAMRAISAAMADAIAGLTTADEVLTIWTRATDIKGDWNMADLILEYIGTDTTYVDKDGNTVTIDRAAVRNALALMQKRDINSAEGALQSPYALYYNWCAVVGKLPK